MSKQDTTQSTLRPFSELKALYPQLGTPGADLSGLDLSNADLRQVDFSGADLTGADLRGSHVGPGMRSAKFKGADITGATLDLAATEVTEQATVDFSGRAVSASTLTGRLSNTTGDPLEGAKGT